MSLHQLVEAFINSFGEAMSNEDVRTRLSAALAAELADNPIPGVYWPDILHVYGNEESGTLIHSGRNGQHYRRTYKISSSKAGQKVELGTREVGFLSTTFQKADARGALPTSTQESEEIVVREDAKEVCSDILWQQDRSIALLERKQGEPVKRVKVRLIVPGWGSSGYYPAEVLKRDGPKIFKSGMHMFWNHDTPMEEMQRPEGDLSRLAAVLRTDAKWESDGLYAEADVKEAYQSALADLAPDIGVSIRASGTYKLGKAAGKEGKIIQTLDVGKSTDFVTRAGAGGKIIQLFEAASNSQSRKENPTMDEDLKRLLEGQQKLVESQQTQIAGLTSIVTNMVGASNRSSARSIFERTVSGSQLPEKAKTFLLAEAFDGVIEGNVLNESATAAKAQAVVTKHAAFLKEMGLSESGKPNGGNQETVTDLDDKKVNELIESAFPSPKDMDHSLGSVIIPNKK